jgi:hypothetical protein
MDLSKLTELGEKAKEKAVELVQQRGGVDALKADAAEVKTALTGDGSLADKAKEAVAAIKDPGKAG